MKTANRERGASTQKGESFELEIKHRLESELRSGMLGIEPSAAHVFHRKRYHSPTRQAHIIFDVSIEIFRPGADKPFLVWIWECKDYVHRVPVDDLEEFHSKLGQIGASLTKGTVACRNGFQEAAIAVARTWGIGLVRMQPDGSLMRLLESVSARDLHPVAEASLTQPAGIPLTSQFFAISGHGQAVDDFGDYVETELAEFCESHQP